MSRPEPSRRDDRFPWSTEANRRRQRRLGLAMPPAERIRWLEETVAEMRKILGRAREPRSTAEGNWQDRSPD